MMSNLPDILSDNTLKTSSKEQKDALSQTLNSPKITKTAQNGFLALAESVASLLVSSKVSNGSFAKNQISGALSNFEDDWKKQVYSEILL